MNFVHILLKHKSNLFPTCIDTLLLWFDNVLYKQCVIWSENHPCGDDISWRDWLDMVCFLAIDNRMFIQIFFLFCGILLFYSILLFCGILLFYSILLFYGILLLVCCLLCIHILCHRYDIIIWKGLYKHFISLDSIIDFEVQMFLNQIK